jgi:uncharacterized phage protein (TIGR01671 family)
MREIKFRVWDKEREKMMTERLSVARLVRGYITGNSGDGLGGSPFDYERYDLLQYTGLKNKHGVEIYEKDIIKTHFKKTEQYDAYTEVGVVNITPYRTEIEDKKHGRYKRFYEHSEVIGNVYEHPNLLTT